MCWCDGKDKSAFHLRKRARFASRTILVRVLLIVETGFVLLLWNISCDIVICAERALVFIDEMSADATCAGCSHRVKGVSMLNTFCKKPLWECNASLIAVAQGERSADTVIRNARLINVCTREVIEACDVAVSCGRVAYVGDASHTIGDSTDVIDAAGRYLAPGFLDGHIHVESSMVGVSQYARAVVPHGTVGIYWDPHEIANVLGMEGVKVMIEDSRRTPLKAMITVPSCVPAVPGFEDTGASIGPEDIALFMNQDGVVGLGEMMNYPGVLARDAHPLNEIGATLKADHCVTGHYAVSERDRGLNAYIASGVRSCHESTQAQDVLAKIRLGMYAQLREGSAWRDLEYLAPAIVNKDIDTRFCNLVSDDTHPHTLLDHGHLDHILRRAVQEGIDPVEAIQMVTINTATCFHMDHELGSIAPGKCADMVLFDSLEDFNVSLVMIDGDVVAEDGEALFKVGDHSYPDWVTSSLHLAPGQVIDANTFRIGAFDEKEGPLRPSKVKVRVMRVLPGRAQNTEGHAVLAVEEGQILADPKQDVLKAFVFERHHSTGSYASGFVTGFGIEGALAQTVAHDAHNLLVVGSDDEDMALAANTLIDCGGGAVAVRNGEVIGLVELPIAGLMSAESVESVSQAVDGLERAWSSMGCSMPSPFMTMALLSLACIPDLRLTNKGLVDCRTFEFVPLIIDELMPSDDLAL